jgi:multidrug efflux pump subunit AcrA (membrane-fusion protein)
VRTVLAPAGPVGVAFRLLESTGFVVVVNVSPSSKLQGQVHVGDVLVRIDDDVPVRALRNANKVAALLRAREHAPVRSLHFAKEPADAERAVLNAQEAFQETRRYREEMRAFQAGHKDAVAASRALEDLRAQAEAEPKKEEQHKEEHHGVKETVKVLRSSVASRMSGFFGAHPAQDPEPEEEEEEEGGFQLPDPNNKADFDTFCEMIVAQECINVTKRMEELHDAVDYLHAKVEQAEAAAEANRSHAHKAELAEARRRLALTTEYEQQFQRRWGLGYEHSHRQHHLHLKFSGHPWWRRQLIAAFAKCGLCLDELTEEERLERIVRAKVKRDVRQACAWDEELSELEFGDKQECRLIELARFELLTAAERKIYLENGGLADDEEPPEPVHAWKKYVGGVVMLGLMVIPTLFLLLFGVSKGKKTTRIWFVSTVTCFVLEWCIYEPIIIGCLHVYLPALIRKKLKSLVDPTQLARFPFKTPLFEYPTTYLAKKHRGLVVARRMLKRRAATASKEALAQQEMSNLAEGVGGSAQPVVASKRPKASTTARLFIMFWMFLIVLNPDLQEMVIMDTLSFITVAVLIIIKWVNHIELWAQISLGFVCAIALAGVVRMCRHHRGAPDEVEADSDDEEEEAEPKAGAETKQPEEEVEAATELATDLGHQQVVLF